MAFKFASCRVISKEQTALTYFEEVGYGCESRIFRWVESIAPDTLVGLS